MTPLPAVAPTAAPLTDHNRNNAEDKPKKVSLTRPESPKIETASVVQKSPVALDAIDGSEEKPKPAESGTLPPNAAGCRGGSEVRSCGGFAKVAGA